MVSLNQLFTGFRKLVEKNIGFITRNKKCGNLGRGVKQKNIKNVKNLTKIDLFVLMKNYI